MDRHDREPELSARLSRRRLLELLGCIGLVGPAAAAGAEARHRFSPEILAQATKLLDRDLDRARLERILPAVQRNMDFFRIVRDLDIEDRIEPPVVFKAAKE